MASEDPDTVPTYTHSTLWPVKTLTQFPRTHTHYIMASTDPDTVPTYIHITLRPLKTLTQLPPIHTVPHGQ
jgi:hypothetical protein